MRGQLPEGGVKEEPEERTLIGTLLFISPYYIIHFLQTSQSDLLKVLVRSYDSSAWNWPCFILQLPLNTHSSPWPVNPNWSGPCLLIILWFIHTPLITIIIRTLWPSHWLCPHPGMKSMWMDPSQWFSSTQMWLSKRKVLVHYPR